MLPGGDLVLENLHPSQEGVYQCRAENKIGSITAQARLTVRERPVLTVTPETRLQVSHQASIYNCQSVLLASLFQLDKHQQRGEKCLSLMF